METKTQTTLGDYLQKKVGGKYEPRKLSQEYILESFWLHELPVCVGNQELQQELEKYYQDKGMVISFGRGWDLSFESKSKDLVGITLSVNEELREALITVNNLRKT